MRFFHVSLVSPGRLSLLTPCLWHLPTHRHHVKVAHRRFLPDIGLLQVPSFHSSATDISRPIQTRVRVAIPSKTGEISLPEGAYDDKANATLCNNEESTFLASLDRFFFKAKKLSFSKHGVPAQGRERSPGGRRVVVSRREEKHNNSAVSEVDAKEETFVSTEEKLGEREKREVITIPLVDKRGKHTSSETLEDISCNREEAGDVEEEICIERTKEEPRRRRSRIKELGRQRSRSCTDRSCEEAFIEGLGQRAKADLARRRRRRASQSRSPSHFSTSSLSSSASPLVEDRSASVFRSTTPLSSSSINPSSRCDHAETKREDLSQRGRTSDSPLSSLSSGKQKANSEMEDREPLVSSEGGAIVGAVEAESQSAVENSEEEKALTSTVETANSATEERQLVV
ncbi:hypothetical protein CSUI_010870, partial [Cystoisospora suis]